MNLFDIHDNIVVITGGTGVLGRCIAAYLAQQGAHVAIIGRNETLGAAITDGIISDGGDAIFLKGDVLSKESMELCCQQVISRYGRIDALLNAAGGNMPGATIGPAANFFDVKVEDFQRVLDLNLTGTVIPTQVFLRPMVDAGRGCIVNFSSMSAFRPLSRVMGYGAAKAGISNWTAYMAGEIATKFGTGIRINAIAPGFFLTAQNKDLLTNPDGSLTARGHDIIRQTPFKRFGTPEELCGTIHYLIAPASAFVTGTVAVVDGGFNTFSL